MFASSLLPFLFYFILFFLFLSTYVTELSNEYQAAYVPKRDQVIT